jgi:hypothetical protein
VVDESTNEKRSIKPQPKFGLIQFRVRPGEYRVRIRLRPLWQEQLGWAATAVGLSLVAISLAWNFATRRATTSVPEIAPKAGQTSDKPPSRKKGRAR